MKTMIKFLLKNTKDINPLEFVFLYLIFIDDINIDILKEKYRDDIDIISLQEKGYIKIINSNKIELRNKGIVLLRSYGINTNNLKTRVENLVVKYRKLFPKGVNNLGYRYAGDRLACINKFTKFLTKYNYSDEEILTATKNYIARFYPSYQGMRQAHYFISKDNGSDLLTELENKSETLEKDFTTINKLI